MTKKRTSGSQNPEDGKKAETIMKTNTKLREAVAKEILKDTYTQDDHISVHYSPTERPVGAPAHLKTDVWLRSSNASLDDITLQVKKYTEDCNSFDRRQLLNKKCAFKGWNEPQQRDLAEFLNVVYEDNDGELRTYTNNDRPAVRIRLLEHLRSGEGKVARLMLTDALTGSPKPNVSPNFWLFVHEDKSGAYTVRLAQSTHVYALLTAIGDNCPQYTPNQVIKFNEFVTLQNKNKGCADKQSSDARSVQFKMKCKSLVETLKSKRQILKTWEFTDEEEIRTGTASKCQKITQYFSSNEQA